jgi:F0F1-type ATP synthase assembly protein I
MNRSSLHREIGASIGAGAEAAGFFSSILSGFLLGLLGDHLLGTEPLLVVFGIIVGSATGFWRMWQYAKRAHDEGR